jgi:exonuclease III
MVIVSLNIRSGGGNRANSILNWIGNCKPDAAIFLEWRDNEIGKVIKRHVEKCGFMTANANSHTPRSNGVLFAAKTFFDYACVTPEGSDKGELLLVSFPGLRLLAAYFPQKAAKSLFFQACQAESEKYDQMPFLLLGDLNTGRNDLDRQATGSRFHCATMFEALVDQSKLVDLWRDTNRDKLQEWTWESPGKCNGFRVDHAFANKPFMDRFGPIECYYDHEPRKSKITDHSALILRCSSGGTF